MSSNSQKTKTELIAELETLREKVVELSSDRANQELRESEERYRIVTELSRDAIEVVSETGETIYVNPAMEEVFGYTPEEHIGQKLQDWIHIIHPDDRDRVADEFERVGKPRKLVNCAPMRCRCKDGRWIWVKVIATPYLSASGKPYILDVTQDITDQVEAEQRRQKLVDQAKEVQRLKSLRVLAGGIAHDFNNLLMGVMGNASLALANLSPGSPACEQVEAITMAAKRAAELCDQLLAYSGRGNFVIELVNLNEIVAETAILLKSTISRRAVLKHDLAENLPRIQGDITQLRQVVINLITNASEALGSDGGVIRITTSAQRCDRLYLESNATHDELPEGDYICLEVSDTGCGMDKDTQEKLFEPFFTTKFAGRGLGLASVLGILRAHRGAVMLQSEPAQGTRFRVLLPALTGLATAPTKEVAAPVVLAGARVLLVDDEEAVLDATKLLLEASGVSVLAVSSGREAIEAFGRAAEDIDCVILDVTMPELDGMATLEQLRRVRRDVRVILSSGFIEEEIASRFAGEGPAGFLKKPYDLAQLTNKVTEVLGT